MNRGAEMRRVFLPAPPPNQTGTRNNSFPADKHPGFRSKSNIRFKWNPEAADSVYIMMDRIMLLWRRERYAGHAHSSNKEFEELLRPHIQPLYRLAVRWCGNTDDAEDLLQAMLCKLYPMHNRIKAVDELRPWLVRVMYRQFVDGIRHKNRQPLNLSDTALSDDEGYHQKMPVAAGTPAEPPEAVFEAGMLTRRLQAALNRMPASRRALIIMHDVESYSLEEISTAMAIPVGTVKSRLHRARERLRELLLNDDGTFFPASAYTVLRTEK